MLNNIAHAKLNVHVVAVIVVALGTIFSVYMHDPRATTWLENHWWANDLIHGLVIAVPPLLVYFGINTTRSGQ